MSKTVAVVVECRTDPENGTWYFVHSYGDDYDAPMRLLGLTDELPLAIHCAEEAARELGVPMENRTGETS